MIVWKQSEVGWKGWVLHFLLTRARVNDSVDLALADRSPLEDPEKAPDHQIVPGLEPLHKVQIQWALTVPKGGGGEGG